MKKPTNKFAMVLWLLAVLLLIGEFVTLWMMLPRTLDVARQAGEATTAAWIAWSQIRGTIGPAIAVAALGYMIELLDQIRWNTRQTGD